MKKLRGLSMFVGMMILCLPRPAVGQDFGAFLDWIHKLSGPGMIGPGASVFWEAERARFRLSGAYLVPVSDDKIEPGHSFNMLSLRPAVEIKSSGPLEASVGVDLHRFGGDGHDAVVKLSVPFYGQIRTSVGGTCCLRLAVGARYFPGFDASDFDGAIAGLTDRGEFSFSAMLGFDFIGR